MVLGLVEQRAVPARLLITGGCGFIGSNLIPLVLAREDLAIRVLDDESAGSRKDIERFDVEFVRGDLNDSALVAKALEGVDMVVHLAADTRVMDSIAAPERNFRTNVVGTFNLLCRMKEAGVRRIVNASTGGAILGEVDPPISEEMAPFPLAPYGASKLAAEGYCSAFSGAYGFVATSLRFSNVYGPRSYHKGSVVAHFFKQILAREELVVYGDGSQTRDYVFVGDICEGIHLAMRAGRSGVFQLGSGRPTTLESLISQMKAVVGDAFPVRVAYRPFRPGELRHTWCDIGKARGELAFDPKTSLGSGLAQTWTWFLETMAQAGE
jgi:UDP-glucose 4-epimerase